MADNGSNTIIEAPVPESRVRSSTPVLVVTVLVGLLIFLVGLFAGVMPFLSNISDSNEARAQADKETEGLEIQKADLVVKRDAIVEQYDAIRLFSERYPSTPQQDTLFQDLQNSALFAGVNIDAISTDYPQLLSDGSYEEGAVITPDQIVINPTEADASAAADAPDPVTAAPGTDVAPGDSDLFPLGTIPLTLNATLDGSSVFRDVNGITYVASPHLGYYTFGGTTDLPRLTMSLAEESTTSALLSTYFATTGTSTAIWSTVFTPDASMPPYLGVENLGAMSTADLVEMYPTYAGVDDVAVPSEWAGGNGFVPLSDISRSAWLIDEIHNSPGRAILIRFVSASGSTIVISGQQFILRELPPLPEEIFGGLIDGLGEPLAAPSGSPTPSPTPSASTRPSPSPSVNAYPSPSATPSVSPSASPAIDKTVEATP